jgi:hypothetical protein
MARRLVVRQRANCTEFVHFRVLEPLAGAQIHGTASA